MNKIFLDSDITSTHISLLKSLLIKPKNDSHLKLRVADLHPTNDQRQSFFPRLFKYVLDSHSSSEGDAYSKLTITDEFYNELLGFLDQLIKKDLIGDNVKYTWISDDEYAYILTKMFRHNPRALHKYVENHFNHLCCSAHIVRNTLVELIKDYHIDDQEPLFNTMSNSPKTKGSSYLWKKLIDIIGINKIQTTISTLNKLEGNQALIDFLKTKEKQFLTSLNDTSKLDEIPHCRNIHDVRAITELAISHRWSELALRAYKELQHQFDSQHDAHVSIMKPFIPYEDGLMDDPLVKDFITNDISPMNIIDFSHLAYEDIPHEATRVLTLNIQHPLKGGANSCYVIHPIIGCLERFNTL